MTQTTMSTPRLQAGSTIPGILYIMGTGRSGTTILDVILSDNPGMVSLGEVTHIFRDGFLEKRRCACGHPAPDCTFWGEVGNRLGLDEARFSQANELFHSVGWHRNFFALLLGLTSARRLEAYRDLNSRLLAAIHEVADAQTAVDSSKYPGRALALSRLFPGRVKIVCLTRAPEGLLAAFRKQDIEQTPKGYLATVLYHAFVLLTCRLAALQPGVDVLHLRYEELTQNPLEALERIERWSGVNLSRSLAKIRGQMPLDIGHMVTGNRLRTKGSIVFKPSAATRTVAGVKARSAVLVMECVRRLLRF